MWIDVTTYIRGDIDQNPKVLKNEVCEIEFLVHKHIHYGDTWLLSCMELHIYREDLNTEDIEEAKIAAINMMKSEISEKILKYKKAEEELDLMGFMMMIE